jgi:hypothetical protein
VSVKDKFTPEEWRTLLRAPMQVGFAVVGADPSGPVGFVKEMSSIASSLIEGEKEAAASSLLGAVVAEIKENPKGLVEQGEKRPTIEEARARAIESCRQVVQILGAKATPEEAESYRRWLASVGRRVAEASREGGFLGFGGVQVSDQELAVLNEISQALGVSN